MEKRAIIIFDPLRRANGEVAHILMDFLAECAAMKGDKAKDPLNVSYFGLKV